MTIPEYRAAYGIQAKELARRIGISHDMISRFAGGYRRPSYRTGIKLVIETAGRVTLADLAVRRTRIKTNPYLP